jgi:histidinol-phosphate aminotransferase
MSKIGFAALRVGYMIADEILINEVNKVRLPYNLNALSQTAALEGIKNKKVVDARIRAITDERERLFDELAALEGVTPFPSEANFILFKVTDPEKIFQGLLKQGVLIKNMDRVIGHAMRVTIGSRAENTIFIDALEKVLNK